MILYYSGTGNSAHTARRTAAALGDESLNLFHRIRGGDSSPLQSERPWIIVCPTYAWRIPRILEAHLSQTKLLGNRDVYFLLTCGDSIGNASAYARSLCESMGLVYRGMAKIVMPENYIALFDAPEEKEARQIVAAADAALDSVIEIIRAAKDLPEARPGFADRFMSSIVNPVFYGLVVKDKKFRTDGKCTLCGKCAKLCPMNNIEIEGGKPVWKGNCTHCMACICSCPAGAIEYSRASLGKPRYKCPQNKEESA